MLVGLTEHARFVELVATARLTVEEKLLMGITVMVEFPKVPVCALMVSGLADNVKSGATVTV